MAFTHSEQTERTLLRHWQAFGAGDIEAIMADYADDAILITPEGTLKGEAQIRSLFEKIFAEMFPPASSLTSRSKSLKTKQRTSSGREVRPNVMRRLPPILL